MSSIAAQYNGFYQRYSDDFILILPLKIGSWSKINDFKEIILNRIEELSNINKIRIQKEKLEYRLFHQQEIIDVDQFKPSQIDYLGFTFNGIDVKIRERSIGKFYRDAKKTHP